MIQQPWIKLSRRKEKLLGRIREILRGKTLITKEKTLGTDKRNFAKENFRNERKSFMTDERLCVKEKTRARDKRAIFFLGTGKKEILETIFIYNLW